jgi:hypothetical protein
MPRLAKKMGIAPFASVPDALLVPVEYSALAYYVNRTAGSATAKLLTMVVVGFGYETYLAT